MKTNLPKPGSTCYVKDFDSDAWSIRTFWGVGKGPLFRYITYDRRSDEIEEWVIIKFEEADSTVELGETKLTKD